MTEYSLYPFRINSNIADGGEVFDTDESPSPNMLETYAMRGHDDGEITQRAQPSGWLG